MIAVLRRCLPVAALLTLALLPSPAAAAEGYGTAAWTACAGTRVGGQFDEQGRLYTSCGTYLYIEEANGTSRKVNLAVTLTDVAPSPTGAYVYGMTGSKVVRWNRTATNGYARDAVWKLGRFPLYNTTYEPGGAYLATDGYGDIYVSNANNARPNVIVKYAADGSFITRWGGWTGTGEPGMFNLNAGVVASRDARHVYVVEKTGGRVQRFDQQLDGGYRLAVAWGASDPLGCRAGNFAAPGDVGVDAWGFVYVMDTTCERIQKFTAGGNFLYQLKVGGRTHNIAVDWKGNMRLGENTRKSVTRTTPLPTATMPVLPARLEPAFRTVAKATCPNEPWTNGAGQAANDGTVYVACAGSIFVAESNGTVKGRIALPAGAHYYDVAPSPDESFLYVTRVIDVGGRPEVKRFARQDAAGSLVYALDNTWKAADFVWYGMQWKACGRYIATDAWGDLYFSNSGWCGYFRTAFDVDFVWEPAASVVVKYSPAGAVKTLFGSNNPTLGEFDVNMGVATTRDGRQIWTIEHGTGRTQRFDHQADGTYKQTAAVISFGKRDDTCSKPGSLSVPYDIGVDPWGDVWIANTGCERVERYSAAGVQKNVVSVAGQLHGLAVDHQGNVWVGARNLRVERTASNPVPGPLPVLQPLPAPPVVVPPPVADTQAPVLREVIIPDPTPTLTIQVQIAAEDNVAVKEVRFANEDGIWGPWQPYSNVMTHTLRTSAVGAKAVTTQVRDAAGNESNTILRRTLCTCV